MIIEKFGMQGHFKKRCLPMEGGSYWKLYPPPRTEIFAPMKRIFRFFYCGSRKQVFSLASNSACCPSKVCSNCSSCTSLSYATGANTMNKVQLLQWGVSPSSFLLQPLVLPKKSFLGSGIFCNAIERGSKASTEGKGKLVANDLSLSDACRCTFNCQWFTPK